ncbi:ammonium transporter [Leptothoe spongobia]|uniref:Ammonium transporter n=1 Tax=Leptothoe spongobia TAU-MAC 1115 TaxID=1967444 RepID=A0A947DEH5_9CYAN|nr:ammonium transporter [Leptothoe spongobia]MBT9315436.1 ammonium transporter [Leptothoe spongobia TAU-MAC 1115]
MMRQFHQSRVGWRPILFLTVAIWLVWNGAVLAADSALEPLPDSLQVTVDTMWVLLCAALVFFMNAGFAMLETGFCQSKNAVNVLTKNLIVFGVVSLCFWAVGFAIMFGDGNSVVGYSGFFLRGLDLSPLTGDRYSGVFSSLAWAGIPLDAKFFFQLVFAGAAATIVSGAVAERISFFAFFTFSAILSLVIYPVVGHWVWGGGFLQSMGFWDFAGSTVVHSVGGWSALTGAWMLGPRSGRYGQGAQGTIPGHNLAIATLGGLILWFGWFGFNAGSSMAADPAAASRIILTTNLAASTGAVAAAIVSWLVTSKPDLGMIINGALAGLVSITAGCAYVAPTSAIIIGFIGGMFAVFAANLFNQWHIDDPVGALPVHLVGGIWGTLAVGLFSTGPGINPWHTELSGPALGTLTGGNIQPILIQLMGVAIVAVFVGLSSLLTWFVLQLMFGLRVSHHAESVGLDLSEHGLEAYPDFSQRSLVSNSFLPSITSNPVQPTALTSEK